MKKSQKKYLRGQDGVGYKLQEPVLSQLIKNFKYIGLVAGVGLFSTIVGVNAKISDKGYNQLINSHLTKQRSVADSTSANLQFTTLNTPSLDQVLEQEWITSVRDSPEDRTPEYSKDKNIFPWYKRMDYKFEKEGYHLKYDLLKDEPSAVVFYPPMAMSAMSWNQVLQFAFGNPEEFTDFLQLFAKSVFYALDVNGDGKTDVSHEIHYLPQRYLKDDYVNLLYTEKLGETGTLLRIRGSCGTSMDIFSKKKAQEITVNADVDLPPFDGKFDLTLKDYTNPNSFGGDGTIDDIEPLDQNKHRDSPNIEKNPDKYHNNPPRNYDRRNSI